MAQVKYTDVSCRYPGSDTLSVADLDLDIAEGEFMVLVGPSGSGKTTALRLLAGLEELSDGTIEIDGRNVSGVDARDRDIAMVFQNYALYPNKNVAENIGFALKMQGVARAERDQRVKEAAQMLGIEEYLKRKPRQLSGGQRQRVAMGRAIVRRPKAFLMDEPLSNLDAKLRVQTRVQIAELQRRLKTTTVYVTHDQGEAMTLGHRVAVLKDGSLQQCAPPRELYDDPVNAFVASFIGLPQMNLITLPVADGQVTLGDERLALPEKVAVDARRRGAKEIIVGIRPEHVTVADGAASEGIPGEVQLVESLGADSYIHATLAGAGSQQFVARTEGYDAREPGSTVRLRIDPSRIYGFDAKTEQRLGTEASLAENLSPAAAVASAPAAEPAPTTGAPAAPSAEPVTEVHAVPAPIQTPTEVDRVPAPTESPTEVVAGPAPTAPMTVAEAMGAAPSGEPSTETAHPGSPAAAGSGPAVVPDSDRPAPPAPFRAASPVARVPEVSPTPPEPAPAASDADDARAPAVPDGSPGEPPAPEPDAGAEATPSAAPGWRVRSAPPSSAGDGGPGAGG